MRQFALLLLSVFSVHAFAQTPNTVIPFTIINGHTHIALELNDSEPLHFIFDTGAAANLMSEETAEMLDIKITGERQVQGASGATTLKNAGGQKITVKGESIENVDFLVVNIDHLKVPGVPLNGIIGFELLNAFVVEIDYEQSEIKLFKKEGFEAPAGWTKETFSLMPFRVPVVNASITLPTGEKISGPYLVDTGAAVSVKFNTPFVKKHKLIGGLGKHYTLASIGLSNAEASDEVSKLPGYEVFGHSFTDFAVRLSKVESGVSSFPQIDGILGIDILKRFNAIYDYANQAMYVKPNSFYSDAFYLNHDGLHLSEQEEGFLVDVVMENSAASAAGIQVGDLITALDGKKDYTRAAFHRYIQQAEKAVEMVVVRDGWELKVNLTPKAVL